MSAPIPWDHEKNEKAERALSRADQLVAVLQLAQLWDSSGSVSGAPDQQRQILTEGEREAVMTLALGMSHELRTLLEQILPDPRVWDDAEFSRWREVDQRKTA